MIINRDGRNGLIVTRGDATKVRGGSWGSAESAFYARLRDVLRAEEEEDVIRQVPENDGHMVSAAYYIRDRRGRYCYLHGKHQIESAAEVYNNGGTVQLERHNLQGE